MTGAAHEIGQANLTRFGKLEARGGPFWRFGSTPQLDRISQVLLTKNMTEAVKRIGEGIWAVDGLLKGSFPLRMAVLEGEDGRLTLWSPVKMERQHADAIARLGTPARALAPNSFHHLYLGATREYWPDIELLAAPGVAKKQPALTLRTLESGTTRLDPAIETRLLPPMRKLDEAVTLHRPSKTLIVADLVFNIHDVKSWQFGLALRLGGTHKRFAQSRLIGLLIKDKAAMRSAYEEVLSWDFDRLVMSHGDIIETGAKDRLAKALLG
jgi:hypothetical protein